MFLLNELNKQSKEIREAVIKTFWEIPYLFTPGYVKVDLNNKEVTYYTPDLEHSKSIKFK